MPRFIRLANYAKCAAPDQTGCQQANEDGRCTFRHQCPAACAKPQLQTPLPVDNFVTFVDCIDADSKKLSLAALHRRTIAVQVALAGEERVLLGQGRFVSDFNYGNVLKIKFLPSAGCEMMIVEDHWSGEVLCGKSLGCDYLIRL